MKDENYYIDVIKINEWLVEDLENKQSVIRFSDRIEHYLGDKLHNPHDAAIIWLPTNNQPEQKEYYLMGVRYDSKTEWEKYALKHSRADKIKKLYDQ